jgi:anthranilate synthase component 1
MSAGLAGFRALARRGNVVPVWRDIPGDCLTPVLCWLSLARRSKRSFLLESVEGGETLARYSFVGRDPWRCLTARGRRIRDEQGRAVVESDGDILGHLREVFAGLTPAEAPDLPRFTGGAVGWIGYDAARRFEPAGFPRARAPRKEALPDAWFGFYDSVVAFDHLRQSLVLIALARAEQDGRRLAAQHADAVRRLDRLASDLARPLPRAARHRAAAHPAAVRTSGADRARYREMVRRARHCAASTPRPTCSTCATGTWRSPGPRPR